ncbi:MAG: class II fructose-bisphosphate aldolase [Candidatus Yanofskybacteria bacterium]|nr:class II fructose-bisphosphate aldolase [Candidatus Yanofskybacteria bacterium]
MKTLKQYFQEAMADQWALGHFNFSTADQLKAFVEAATEMKSPIMVGTSEGEADFIGREQAVALVESYQKEGHAVFLNSDHHKSWETAKAAIDSGYDTVLIDASKLKLEENIELTKKVKEYAKSINSEIAVEGELGYLRGSSEVQTAIEISPFDYTQPEQAQDFVTLTGVDRLAVVFGNIHGIVTEQEEHLDIEHLKKITQVVPEVPLVLHGASGLPVEEIKMAIQNGIANVHINTELRVAYRDTLHEELEKEPTQTTPYKYLKPSYEEMKRMIKKYLELFGSVGKI